MSRSRSDPNAVFRESAQKIIKELKEASKENIQALSRFSIWNSIFVDEPIIPDTKIRSHFNNILRRHLIGSTSPQRFLFELSVYMIDLPELYLSLIDLFPFPYTVAGRLAYRAVVQHIEPTPETAEEDLIRAVAKYEKNPPAHILQLLDKKVDKVSTFEQFIGQIINKVHKEVLEAIIRCFPPQIRIKYSIKCGCTPPKLMLDLSKLSMPYEFLQAIADISGPEQATQLIDEE